jgi:predicted SPOUT superfamily RNA methylase MTH1
MLKNNFFIEEKNKFNISILLPASFTIETPHLREKTLRIGFIARALATYRIGTVIFYPENKKISKIEKENFNIIKKILDYINTAPYLRKFLFKISPELKYASLLPPLQIPTHAEKINFENIIPHYRQGLVIKTGKNSIIEAGLNKKIISRKKLKKNKRIIIKIDESEKGIKFKILSRKKASVYDGFRTYLYEGDLKKLIESFDLSIATSKYGLSILNLIEDLRKKLKEANRICIAFGPAKYGLYEVFKNHGYNLEEIFNYVINTIPYQGVKTIRTEEALFSTLSIINILVNL